MLGKFIDYDGPSGAFVATERGILPLDDPRAMAAVMDSGMLVGLGYSERAAEYAELAKAELQGASERALTGADL